VLVSDTTAPGAYLVARQHWHLRGDDGKTAVEDVAWSLPHPLPEGLAALEHVCFYPDKIELEVDGQRVTT